MSTIPSLAPLTIAGVSTTDGRGIVPQALLIGPLRVRIPGWTPEPAPGDQPHVLTLLWDSYDGRRTLATRTVSPPPPAFEPFYELDIGVANLRDTRVAQLFYRVDTEGGTNESLPIPITIDVDYPRRLTPSDTLQFVVPPVPALNAQYLLTNPTVGFQVPVYNIAAPGDRIEFYLSNSANPPTNLAPAGSGLVNFTTPMTVSLDAAAFRGLSDGAACVFYRIFDATGNYSTRSDCLPFTVNLGNTVPIPMPGGSLPAPRVQHTLTNGYLNCASVPTVVDGVRWLIAADTRILVGDEIRFVWQGFNENNWATQNPSVVFRSTFIWSPTNTTAGAPITVDSYATTLLPLRRLASATGSYEVWRAGVRVSESLPGRVRVDLTYSTGCYCSPSGLLCM